MQQDNTEVLLDLLEELFEEVESWECSRSRHWPEVREKVVSVLKKRNPKYVSEVFERMLDISEEIGYDTDTV